MFVSYTFEYRNVNKELIKKDSMKPQKVLETVARYAVHHAETLEGAFDGDKFFQRFYGGDERGLGRTSDVVYGHASDVIGELIWNGNFFGSCISEEPRYACESGNATIIQIDEADQKSLGNVNFSDCSFTCGGPEYETRATLCIRVPQILPHDSHVLTPLRDFHKFIDYSTMVDIENERTADRDLPLDDRIRMLFNYKV